MFNYNGSNMIKGIRKCAVWTKELFLKPVKWPTGLATLVIFTICLVSYYQMSPFYGSLIYPDVPFNESDPFKWFLNVVRFSFLGGFWHGSLGHFMYNMVVTLPCMLVVEKHRGPITMISLYCLMSVVGGIFMFHMTQGLGIGSSCATFGMAVVATYILTSGLSRLVLLVPLVVICMEAAQWWFGMLGDNVGHLAHVGGMVAGFLYILAARDTEIDNGNDSRNTGCKCSNLFRAP